MQGELTGRTVVVTGAAGGIGRATCRALLDAGADIVAVDRDPDALGRLHAFTDGRCHGVVSSLDGPASCLAAVSAAGDIHALVHLAGVYEQDDLGDEHRGAWDRALAVNLTSAFDVCSACLPRLSEGARVILVSSVAYRRGSFDHLGYSASKGGIAGLVRSLARRLAPRVLVNGLAPGIIDTAMPAPTIADRAERLLREIPLGRWGTADEVAGVVRFLCGPAASYITGQILNVDGGMVNS